MPLTVSTKCPSCGGGLEFEQGTNAVRCPFCGQNHVVTGRGRVLSYYIPEKIKADRAVALALSKLKEADGAVWKARDATLFFVPFLHFLGEDLRWEIEETVISEGDGEDEKGFLSWKISVSATGGWDDRQGGADRIAERRLGLAARHVDRTLPALDAPGLNVHSLGLRPEVLKLSLFEKGQVAHRGMLAPVRFSAAAKEEEGYAPVKNGGLVVRRVYGKVVSVIYFPFWLVEAAKGGDGVLAVVDGVSGDVPNPKAPMALLDSLVERDGQQFEVAGLRPLKCPDCGADLPVRPRDVVFFCGCGKAWYLSGSEFAQVQYSVLPPRLKKAGLTPEHFPFWAVRATVSSGGVTLDNKYDLMRVAPGVAIPKEADREVPLRFFVPAFGMGSQKVLSRLAMDFTRNQPLSEKGEQDSFAPRSCYLSREDALVLTPLILFSIIPKGNKKLVQFALDAQVEAHSVELVMIPFYKGRLDYTDGLFGLSVPAASLGD